ncbi:13095_t:CDS:1, partial [Funneliformis caledonium]
ILALQLGQIKPYEGQCIPDNFIQQVTNIFESARNVITNANNINANTFVDINKYDILKGMMKDKFSLVSANDPYTDSTPAINLSTTFTVWLQHKY